MLNDLFRKSDVGKSYLILKRVHEEMMGSVLGAADMVKTVMDMLRILGV